MLNNKSAIKEEARNKRYNNVFGNKKTQSFAEFEGPLNIGSQAEPGSDLNSS